MAVLKVKLSGGYYITQGYPLTVNGEREVVFCGYRVHSRAERVFERLNFQNGEQIPKELFYLLLLDGEISNVQLDSKRLAITWLPEAYRKNKIAPKYIALHRVTMLKEAECLYEILHNLDHVADQKRRTILSNAAFYFLGRYMVKSVDVQKGPKRQKKRKL